jgi:putative transposase
LTQHWFLSLDDAQQRSNVWRIDYNEQRFHSAVRNQTPKEFARKKLSQASPVYSLIDSETL